MESQVSQEPTGPTDEQVAASLSMESITDHLDLPASTQLKVTRPQKEITVYSDTYYITGISDPAQPLELDGELVESRGSMGSFGVFADLEVGANTFVFTQGETEATLTITRSDEAAAGTTEILDNLAPLVDSTHRCGESFVLRCVAPSGGKVTAQVGESLVELTQAVDTDLEGVAAVFTGEYTPEDVSGTVVIGAIAYTLEYGDSTTKFTSQGKLYLVGKKDDLIVRALDACSTVFEEEGNEDAYYGIIRRDAVDVVEEIGRGMYRLSMGGWIFKEAVEPLTTATVYENQVSDTTYAVTGRRETLTLSGTASAPYLTGWEEENLVVTLLHTTGVSPVAVEGSSLFSAILVVEKDGDTILTMTPKEPGALWGYLVEYSGNNTLITFTAQPQLAEGNQPLTGVTILVDPGHGGTDGGAQGVARDDGPDEKQINLATAKAVQRYLEMLGATVVMTHTEDKSMDINSRLEMSIDCGADLMISLHCNSILATSDGTKPSGVEIHYFHENSRPLATELLESIVEKTGRVDREVKNSYYKVTLNSYTPSVLVEMGFITNPKEYDSLRQPKQIYNMAKAIGDGVIQLLQ